jgi:hypothetical protein
MDKILGLSIIAAIFIVAWLLSSKKKVVAGNNKDSFEEIPEAPRTTHLQRRDRVSGKRFRRVYPPLNKRSIERKERHWIKVYNYRLRGILWTPFGLYWMTRQLAEEHR